MDSKIEFGIFILFSIAIFLFSNDNYHCNVTFALKDSVNSGSISSITKTYSFNSTLPLPLPLPLPFNSHIVDTVDNNDDQQSLKNYLIPFP
jgi:hypothetical protein